MFFYKITVRSRRGNATTSTNHFREALRMTDVGDAVARHLQSRSVKAVTVDRISQAAYMRATRGSE